MIDTLIKHIAACDSNIDHALAYRDASDLERLLAEHTALWRLLLEVDHNAAMEYRANPEVEERARLVSEFRNH